MKVRKIRQFTIAQYQAVVDDFLKTGDAEYKIAKRQKVSVGQVDRILNRYWNSRSNAIVRNLIQ